MRGSDGRFKSGVFYPEGHIQKKIRRSGPLTPPSPPAPLPWSELLTVRLNRVAQGGGRGGVLRESWQVK
ncbi:unnamed protein product, partial [Pleuronectes platessa]